MLNRILVGIILSPLENWNNLIGHHIMFISHFSIENPTSSSSDNIIDKSHLKYGVCLLLTLALFMLAITWMLYIFPNEMQNQISAITIIFFIFPVIMIFSNKGLLRHVSKTLTNLALAILYFGKETIRIVLTGIRIKMGFPIDVHPETGWTN